MESTALQVKLAVVLLLGLVAQPPAAAQSQSLDQLLDRTGKSVARFLDELALVSCNEDVLQEKLNPKGKSEERVASTFEYLVLVQTQKDEPVLYESRQAVHEVHSKKHVSLLVSNGFATQLLIFHPFYQPSFTFERLADIESNGKTYAQVRFQHVKGRPTPAVLMVRGREYPISLAGVARIDPSTGVVEHITTELGSSMEDVGLKDMRSDVEYSLVGFTKEAKSYWLPVQATIEVSTARQHWKNVHHFTGYHLFSVNVSQEVDVNKIKAKEPQ
jgi:hypothetical protein